MLTSSVVVPILNAARTLPACLRALDRLRPAPDEVILVDNGSTDESLLLAKTFAGESHPFRVQLLCAAPRGASTARNTGIKAAGGDIIVFTDADCTPEPDWLGRLLDPFADHKIGAVAGRVVGDPGSTLPELFSTLYTLRLPKEASLHDHWTPIQGGYPTANLAVRRTVLDRLQGFDECVTIYGEDHDLCARLYQAGWRLLYRPEAQVIHHHRTTLRALLGLTDRRTGSVEVRGRETIALSSHQIARLGLGYCPEERGIFSSLSCEENLMLLPKVGAGEVTLSQIYEMFPNLYERRHSQGTRLSGGEQQMLAMARILRTGARLLLLDEISEGLAPVIVQRLGQIIRQLKEKGFTILLVEQNFRFASRIADRFYVMEHGAITLGFPGAELRERMPMLHEVLGV